MNNKDKSFLDIEVNDILYRSKVLGTVEDNQSFKQIRSKYINLNFNKSNGYTEMFGPLENEFSPIGPFIADIEISTKCYGVPNKQNIKTPCKFCYKSNNEFGQYMNIETYKKVLNKLNYNNTITQVALGVDSEAITNPDLEKILQYTRECGIVPNLTVANINEETAKMLIKYVGAISVSRYENKQICYNTIKILSDLGLSQVNMHFCIHEDSYEDLLETIEDISDDNRLKNLNAIVLLSLKRKGRGTGFKPISQEKFNSIYKLLIDKSINCGFDSCSANKCISASKTYGNYESIKDFIEPCESSLFSAYINVEGKYFPCSFIENTLGWEDGIDLLKINNFLEDVWFSKSNIEFRNSIWNNKDENTCRKCPYYKI